MNHFRSQGPLTLASWKRVCTVLAGGTVASTPACTRTMYRSADASIPRLLTALTLIALAALAAAPASAQIVYNNGTFGASSFGIDITTFAQADDFLVTSSLTFNSIRFYAVDLVNSPTSLVDFNGTVSWFIHTDSGGALPTSTPSTTIVASGSSSSVSTTNTGALAQGRIAWQLDFSLSSAVTLPTGRYWLHLREGAPGAPSDGSSISWLVTNTAVTGNQYRGDFTNNGATPSNWIVTANNDLAFQLLSAPEPGTFALLALGIGCGVGVGGRIVRRRNV